MKNIFIKLFTVFLSFGICLSAYAANENHTLHVYLTNETNKSLTFNRVEGSNPGNHFIVDQKTIKPGERSVITVEKLINNDIAGKVIFTNDNNIEATLYVLDQEQIHYGQPIFKVEGNQHKSILVSKTRNKNVGPRYLSYVEADLRVVNSK